MEALSTIETLNGNLTKNEFKTMNTDHTETAQSRRAQDVKALRKEFDKKIEQLVDKSYILENIQDDKVFDIMFQEYIKTQWVTNSKTYRTLQTVRRLDEHFRANITEPQRTAQAVNRLLETVSPYIKEKVVNVLAKDDYCILTESADHDPVWFKVKSIYDIELLAPEGANN